jgi:hypothetical protein
MRGLGVKRGNQPRTLSLSNDLLTFIIYDSRGNIILTKTSGTGIDQTDDGSYTVVVPADEMNATVFPGSTYRYMVGLTEGDTGEKHLLQHGPFTLTSLPV